MRDSVRYERGSIVPSLYASQPLLLKTFADRLCIYHGEKLIATHTCSALIEQFLLRRARPSPPPRRNRFNRRLQLPHERPHRKLTTAAPFSEITGDRCRYTTPIHHPILKSLVLSDFDAAALSTRKSLADRCVRCRYLADIPAFILRQQL